MSTHRTTCSEPVQGRFFLVNETDLRVGINCLGTGPSVTAAQLELQAELGVHTVLLVGTAGGLTVDQKPGGIVLPTSAVRADGTSDHYAGAGSTCSTRRRALASYTEHLAACRDHRRGRSVLDDGSTVPHDRRRTRLLRPPWSSCRRRGVPRRSSPSGTPETSELPPPWSSTVFRRRTAGGTSTSPRHNSSSALFTATVQFAAGLLVSEADGARNRSIIELT